MIEIKNTGNALGEIKGLMVKTLDSRPDDAELGEMMAKAILMYDDIFRKYPAAYQTFCREMAGRYALKRESKDEEELKDIELYLFAAQRLLSSKKDKEFVGKIRQTFRMMGTENVREDIESDPDVFGISGRTAREVVDRAMTKASEMHDALKALRELIDRNI